MITFFCWVIKFFFANTSFFDLQIKLGLAIILAWYWGFRFFYFARHCLEKMSPLLQQPLQHLVTDWKKKGPDQLLHLKRLNVIEASAIHWKNWGTILQIQPHPLCNESHLASHCTVCSCTALSHSQVYTTPSRVLHLSLQWFVGWAGGNTGHIFLKVSIAVRAPKLKVNLAKS